MTLGGAFILAAIALVVGIELGLWLGEKVDLAPPAPTDDIDWDNAA